MNRLVLVLCALVAAGVATPLNERIANGSKAEDGQFPYVVSVRTMGQHNCAGTIISKRWILTAGHCAIIPSLILSVAVGTTRRSDPNARIYNIEKTIVHNKWTLIPLTNDIGLLRVSEDIEFNDKVQPLQLNTEDISSGVKLTLSGWGITGSSSEDFSEDLQFISLASISNSQCKIKWDIRILSSQLCTFTKYGEGACPGDSGGPLVYNDKIAGIVSYGKPCAIGFPDIFTRVSSFIDWIQQNINN